jgi:hypothetical protein
MASPPLLYTQDILPLDVVRECNLLQTKIKIKNKILKCNISLTNVATIPGHDRAQTRIFTLMLLELALVRVTYFKNV